MEIFSEVLSEADLLQDTEVCKQQQESMMLKIIMKGYTALNQDTVNRINPLMNDHEGKKNEITVIRDVLPQSSQMKISLPLFYCLELLYYWTTCRINFSLLYQHLKNADYEV